VSEIVKHRMNRGERGGLSFYRDQNGLEADLLIEHVDAIDVVEMKSGQTLSSDMLSPARRVAGVLESRGARPLLCYGGDQRQTRSGVEVRPWSDLGIGVE